MATDVLNPVTQDGSSFVVQLGDGLTQNSKQDRNIASDMMDRETRRERILDNLAKSLKVYNCNNQCELILFYQYTKKIKSLAPQ